MKDIKKDFSSFASDLSSPRVPAAVLKNIHAQIERELPSPWVVASKLGGAHLLGSLITLMSCEQFGVQLFFHNGGLMHYFMEISPTFCHVFCGALYFSLTFLVARVLLHNEEWLRIKQSRVLSIGGLALLSLGGFSLVSHEVTFEAGLLWLFGATVGGELVTLIKSPRMLLLRR